MYRPPVQPPVTAWARHLDRVLRDRDWSQTRLFEEVAVEMGYSPKSRTAIRGLFMDTEPTERQAEVLRRHFGEPSPELMAQPTAAELSLQERAVLAAERANDLAAEANELARQRLAIEVRQAAFTQAGGSDAPHDDVLAAELQLWAVAEMARTQRPRTAGNPGAVPA